jgi:hypothetical protein
MPRISRAKQMQNRLDELKRQAAPRLAEIGEAIREKRAYLDTFVGRRIVTGYDYDSGNCITNNGGGWLDDRHFMVCMESIKIDPKS